MVQIYKTSAGKVESIQEHERNCWYNLTAPTTEEIEQISNKLNLPSFIFQDPLDIDERSRIEVQEDYMMIIIRIPVMNNDHTRVPFITLPLGIIMTSNCLITVCAKNNELLVDFINNKIKGFTTENKNRFILQIFYHSAITYLKYLKEINRNIIEVEQRLQKSTKNKEVIEMLILEKSLVYFTTSLKSNEIMMEKVQRNKTFRVNTEEDSLIEDIITSIAMKNEKLMERLQKNQVFIINSEEENLLEDVIIENKQAIEMASIYSNILTGTMDTYASVISNNLNVIMRYLASVTILFLIPSGITSFFSMNVGGIPFNHAAHGFWVVSGIILIITIFSVWFFKKNDWF